MSPPSESLDELELELDVELSEQEDETDALSSKSLLSSTTGSKTGTNVTTPVASARKDSKMTSSSNRIVSPSSPLIPTCGGSCPSTSATLVFMAPTFASSSSMTNVPAMAPSTSILQILSIFIFSIKQKISTVASVPGDVFSIFTRCCLRFPRDSLRLLSAFYFGFAFPKFPKVSKSFYSYLDDRNNARSYFFRRQMMSS
mmetsp:Transcript_41443/g.66596  ORF Transcript_41443/g.66596 Transcript_41443/m.66596 type:complete len:200 (+) Transcript_41443:423-1022(+)